MNCDCLKPPTVHGILTMCTFQFITLLCAREKKKTSQAVLCFSMDSCEKCELMENDEDTECK